MKKLLALLLALTMLTALCACGDASESGAETTDAPGTGASTTEPAGTSEPTGTTEPADTTEPAGTTESVTTEPKVEDYLFLYVDEDVKLIDDASTNADGGGSGNPIQFVDGNGVGYSSLNDIVYFENVDFSKGAGSMTIFFSNGNRSGAHTTLAVYIDDYENSEPVCTFDIKYTGGWDFGYAKPFTVPCEIPAGTHTVYVQYTNTNSGSFARVSFAEAAA